MEEARRNSCLVRVCIIIVFTLPAQPSTGYKSGLLMQHLNTQNQQQCALGLQIMRLCTNRAMMHDVMTACTNTRPPWFAIHPSIHPSKHCLRVVTNFPFEVQKDKTYIFVRLCGCAPQLQCRNRLSRLPSDHVQPDLQGVRVRDCWTAAHHLAPHNRPPPPTSWRTPAAPNPCPVQRVRALEQQPGDEGGAVQALGVAVGQ
jgi:hypothetical protein